MDINTIAGAAISLQSSQTAQNMTMALVKQAAAQQNMMANNLAQNVQSAAQGQPTAATQGYTFSTYA